MTFVPFGAADKIRLTVEIVKNLIAVPTRSGKTCSDRDAVKFMALCQAQRLNPFAGDAFLVGYDNSQSGTATFSLITAHVAFLKRAETCQDFEGMESGIVLLNEETGETQDREGDFHLPNEKVVGGWARVHRKNRKPTYRRLRMERFNKGFAQWKEDPAGMIVKCAESDALRSTFPTLLGGLYSEGEAIIEVASERVGARMIDSSRLVDVRTEAKLEPTSGNDEGQLEAQERPATQQNANEELGDFIIDSGYTFDHFQKFAMEENLVPGADSMAGFEDISDKDAKRLLKARTGLLTGMKKIKEGAA